MVPQNEGWLIAAVSPADLEVANADAEVVEARAVSAEAVADAVDVEVVEAAEDVAADVVERKETRNGSR